MFLVTYMIDAEWRKPSFRLILTNEIRIKTISWARLRRG